MGPAVAGQSRLKSGKNPKPLFSAKHHSSELRDDPKYFLNRFKQYLALKIIPPRKVVRGRPARRNVEEQGVPNAPEVQPQGEVTNDEFLYASSKRVKVLRKDTRRGEKRRRSKDSSISLGIECGFRQGFNPTRNRKANCLLARSCMSGNVQVRLCEKGGGQKWPVR
uniref:Uncharacterized protein n=1 Tax=Solanum tuberosum TaxID=4113 RepID=M1DVI9_SOLTU